MSRYRKLIIISAVLILISNFKVQAQVISDNVHFYLTKNINIELLIYNGSKDTVVINDFNRYIHHVSAFEYYNHLRGLSTVFYWDFLTLSNQKPKIGLVISAHNIQLAGSVLEEKNFDIVIPPNDIFVSEVIMMSEFYMYYERGHYYKLRLYYAKTGQCVAEMVVFHGSRNPIPTPPKRRRFLFF